MAKTDKFPVEKVIEAIKKTGGLLALAAEMLKCNQRTVRNYRERYQAVRDAIDEARELNLDIGEAQIIKALKAGEQWAIKYYVNANGKMRGYGRTQELPDLEAFLVENFPQSLVETIRDIVKEESREQRSRKPKSRNSRR